MIIMRSVILLTATLMGVWFIFDGLRAIVQGDYTTASSGPHAGQLGPWSKLVGAAGVNPRGTAMKVIHVFAGASWLLSAVLFAAKPSLGRPMLAVSAVCSLWYLPLGTVLAMAELCMLFLPQVRNIK